MSKRRRSMRETVAFYVGAYAIATACLIADGLSGVAFTLAWLAILAGIAAGLLSRTLKADREV